MQRNRYEEAGYQANKRKYRKLQKAMKTVNVFFSNLIKIEMFQTGSVNVEPRLEIIQYNKFVDIMHLLYKELKFPLNLLRATKQEHVVMDALRIKKRYLFNKYILN